MLKIHKYHKDHVKDINLPYALSGVSRDALTDHDDIVGYTLMDKDVILCIGGVHNMWQGVGEAWLVVSEEGFLRPMTIAKYVAGMFEVLESENDFKRIQASVSMQDDVALRFVQWLGFDEEGVMRKYGLDGSDYARFARVN